MTSLRLSSAIPAPLLNAPFRAQQQRLYAFGFTGLLHIAAITGLLLALQHTWRTPTPPAIEWKAWVDEAVPPRLPAPLAPQLLETRVTQLEQPDYEVEPSTSERAISRERIIARVNPTPLPPRAAPRIVLPQLPRQAPSPGYPSVSRRLGEEGTVLLQFRVAADGRVRAGSIEVLEGSGFPRLDAAARLAILRVVFQPGTRDGVAAEMQHSFRFTYALD